MTTILEGTPPRRVPEFVVVRADGRYFAEHHRVGFLFEVDGRWVRSPRLATKYPSRRIAEQVAAERGGVAMALETRL